MRRVYTTSVLLMFVSAVAMAGPLSGLWDTDISFTVLPGGGIGSPYFASSILVAYELSSWTGAAIATFSTGPSLSAPIAPILWGGDGLSSVAFFADGTLGAFTLGSLAFFSGDPGLFTRAQGFAAVSLAGAELFSFVALENRRYSNHFLVNDGLPGNNLYGIPNSAGAVIGAYGWTGACWIGAEVGLGLGTFGGGLNPGLSVASLRPLSAMLSQVFYAMAYNVPASIQSFWRENEACQGALLYPYGSCDLAFTYANFYALLPMACVDLYSAVRFDDIDGFSSAEVMLLDVDLGLSWARLSELAVLFTEELKAVYLDFDLTLLDAVCITPYLSVLSGGVLVPATDVGPSGAVFPQDLAGPNVIDGISLDGLMLECSMDGITFIASEVFLVGNLVQGVYLTATGRICQWTSSSFAARQCCDIAPFMATEAIAIEIDGDTCCGASFSAGIYSFFYPEHGAIFDWVGTVTSLTYGFSESLSLDVSLQVGAEGLQSLGIGLQFTWGSPPDYGDCCSPGLASS